MADDTMLPAFSASDSTSLDASLAVAAAAAAEQQVAVLRGLLPKLLAGNLSRDTRLKCMRGQCARALLALKADGSTGGGDGGRMRSFVVGALELAQEWTSDCPQPEASPPKEATLDQPPTEEIVVTRLCGEIVLAFMCASGPLRGILVEQCTPAAVAAFLCPVQPATSSESADASSASSPSSCTAVAAAPSLPSGCGVRFVLALLRTLQAVLSVEALSSHLAAVTAACSPLLTSPSRPTLDAQQALTTLWATFPASCPKDMIKRVVSHWLPVLPPHASGAPLTPQTKTRQLLIDWIKATVQARQASAAAPAVSASSSSAAASASSSSAAVTVTSSVPLRRRPLTSKAGLVNMGNTCFASSVLQSLFLTDALRRDLLSLDARRHWGLLKAHRTLLQLQNLFASLLLTHRTAIAPTTFHSNLPDMFRDASQQDAGEFAKFVLDALGTAMNKFREDLAKQEQDQKDLTASPSAATAAPAAAAAVPLHDNSSSTPFAVTIAAPRVHEDGVKGGSAQVTITLTSSALATACEKDGMSDVSSNVALVPAAASHSSSSTPVPAPSSRASLDAAAIPAPAANVAVGPSKPPAIDMSSDAYFGGQLVSTITCLTCHTRSNKVEAFLELTLALEIEQVQAATVEANSNTNHEAAAAAAAAAPALPLAPLEAAASSAPVLTQALQLTQPVAGQPMLDANGSSSAPAALPSAPLEAAEPMQIDSNSSSEPAPAAAHSPSPSLPPMPTKDIIASYLNGDDVVTTSSCEAPGEVMTDEAPPANPAAPAPAASLAANDAAASLAASCLLSVAAHTVMAVAASSMAGTSISSSGALVASSSSSSSAQSAPSSAWRPAPATHIVPSGPLHLSALLSHYFSPEVLSGSDAYLCSRCSAKRASTKVLRVETAPAHLLICLKRNKYELTPHGLMRNKTLKEVFFPCVLKLPVVRQHKESNCDDDSNGGQQPQDAPAESKAVPSAPGSEAGAAESSADGQVFKTYVLYSVIFHSGTSAQQGHYYTISRHSDAGALKQVASAVHAAAPNDPASEHVPDEIERAAQGGEWFCCNDSSVTPSSFEHIVRTTKDTPTHVAYLLFYRALDALTAASKEELARLTSDDLMAGLSNSVLAPVARDNEAFANEQRLLAQMATRAALVLPKPAYVPPHQSKPTESDSSYDADMC